MAKAVFERVFTIKGAEVYVEREAPEAFTAVQPAPEPLHEPEQVEAKEVREIRHGVEAASKAVDVTQESSKALNSLLKEFDKDLPGLADMLSRFCSYFEQARAQNLPWQEKLAMERVSGELKKIFEKLAVIEKTSKVDIDDTIGGYDETLETLKELAPKAGASFKPQIDGYWQEISGLRSSINKFASYFSNTLSSLNGYLLIVDDFFRKKTRAEEISWAVSGIIENLRLASELAAKLHDEIVPQLLNLMAGSRKLFPVYDIFIEKIEQAAAKPAAVVEPAPAETAGVSNTYLLMKNRVEANLEKLLYMGRMAYFMELVEADKSVSAAFPNILKFYGVFKRAIASGKERRIAWCVQYERRIASYLERLNTLLFRLSTTAYTAGGSDYDDYIVYLKKYKKTNPDFLVPGLTQG